MKRSGRRCCTGQGGPEFLGAGLSHGSGFPVVPQLVGQLENLDPEPAPAPKRDHSAKHAGSSAATMADDFCGGCFTLPRAGTPCPLAGAGQIGRRCCSSPCPGAVAAIVAGQIRRACVFDRCCYAGTPACRRWALRMIAFRSMSTFARRLNSRLGSASLASWYPFIASQPGRVTRTPALSMLASRRIV